KHLDPVQHRRNMQGLRTPAETTSLPVIESYIPTTHRLRLGHCRS
ncbi:uncharacterized, partial [Tachysurus ichikawai]